MLFVSSSLYKEKKIRGKEGKKIGRQANIGAQSTRKIYLPSLGRGIKGEGLFFYAGTMRPRTPHQIFFFFFAMKRKRILDKKKKHADRLISTKFNPSG